MICEHVPLPTGGHAIVCSRGRRKRCACGSRADLLCDWKVEGKRSGSCDAPICSRCTTSPAPEKDLCPKHAEALAEWKQQRKATS